jgi:NitT/TauT family transport system substrate-binding protein
LHKTAPVLFSPGGFLAGVSASGMAEEKFTFLTNWYAQAEHGGFYQAQA